MSGTIRPVTSRIPSSWDVWDQTQLPLAVTVQPLWKAPPPPRRTNGDDTEDHIVYTPPPLQQIPKCQHCGAPHPDENTQTVLSRPSRAVLTTQAVGAETTTPKANNNKKSGGSHTSSTTFLCYLCHKISTVSILLGNHSQGTTQTTTRSYNGNQQEQNGDAPNTNASTDAWTFALPLRLHPPTTDNQELVYRVPALTCPLLWYIVLDGTTTADWYWAHVSHCLQATFAEIPSHVHVAVVLAYAGEQFGLFQIDAAVPHVRRYPVAVGADWATLLVEAAVPVQRYRTNLQAIARACAQIPLPPPPSTSSTVSSSSPTDDNNKGTSHPSWTWLVEQIATGLVELGQPAGQRKAPNRTWLPYAGAFGTCFRASTTTTSSANTTNFVPRNILYSRRQRALARICAQAVLTLQTVFVIAPTISAQWYDTGYEHPPILSSVEAPALAWYAATEVTATQGWETWKATWPWRKSVGYGGNVRLRTSPGLVVATDDDDEWLDENGKHDDDDDIGKAAPTTTRLLPKDGGLTGPAVAAPESECLWTLPSLDPYTTLVIDLALDDEYDFNTSPSDAPRPKVGMLQVCVAYTALESDEDGKAWTVRRIKVAHRAMQRVATVESLYRRVDPEALAVVLLHKLVRCGVDQRQSIGEEWLEAFLVAVYQSALEEDKRQEDLRQNGIPDKDGYFLPAERLLSKNEGGDLSSVDVLLAQGHGRLQPIVLLMFLLLQQCQMANTSSSSSSLDRDGLSLSDLVRMSPDSLTRCLAPRLQLWSNDEVLVDLIDLKYETVVNTIQEESALLKNPFDSLLIILDAPDQIIVGNALAVLPGSMEAMDKLPARLGPNLQATLNEMAASYPTPPPILYGGSGSWLTEVCREDSPLGSAPDFGSWRQSVAKAVHKQLIQTRQINGDSNGEKDDFLEV